MTHLGAAASCADAVRRLSRQVTVAAVLSVGWCLALLLVVDPWSTVPRDVAALYGSQVGGLSPFLPVVGLVAGAGVLPWLASLVVVRRLAEQLDASGRRLLGVACSAGVLGAVVMVTTLLYPFVGLGLYSRAETLGTAPPSASLSAAAVATLAAGAVALVVAAVSAGKVPEHAPASAPAPVRSAQGRVGR